MSQKSTRRSNAATKEDYNEYVMEKGTKKRSKESTSKLDPGKRPPKPDIPDCAVCLQSCIHPVELPCSHVFCFLCMKGASTQHRRCALCRQEIPVDFFSRPKLLFHQDDDDDDNDDDEDEEGKEWKAEEGEKCYTWFYEGRNGWWQYEERPSAELEESYCANKRTFDLLIAGYVYVIDLDSMLQYRRADPSRRRRIKRDLVSAPKKGIAGLKINVKKEKESEERQVVGAEEEKEKAGAIGGATSRPLNNGTVKTKKGESHTKDVTRADGKKKSESGDMTSLGSPNANHSNSTSDDSVYEVVGSTLSHRTDEHSNVASCRYTSSSVSLEQTPVYAISDQQRRSPAHRSNTNDSQSTHDGQILPSLRSPTAHSAAPNTQVSGIHQRTHSAPEARRSGRPRYPAPAAPPRNLTQDHSNQLPRMDNNIDSNNGHVADMVQSELIVSVDSTSHAGRRHSHQYIHDV